MAVEFKLPDLGEGIHEAEILGVIIEEGQEIKEDQPLFEVETDKAVVQIPSPHAGVVEKIYVKPGQIVTVGSVLAAFEVDRNTVDKGSAAQSAAASAHKQASTAPPSRGLNQNSDSAARQPDSGMPASKTPVPAAPTVRRLARELGVDLHLVTGSGPGNRVLEEDVRKFARPEKKDAATGKFKPAPDPDTSFELPDFAKWGTIERVALKSIRRKIAMNMTQSWSHIPHVTHFDEADVTGLQEIGTKSDAGSKERNGRLTLTAVVLKAIVTGLKQYPQFNASLDEKENVIIFKNYYHIGIAVATDRGLIVPVIKDVDKKSIFDLAAELQTTVEKTKLAKIELENLQGGTFTLTNIGSIGGTGMVPMINYPESAILGMARAALKPVVKDGKIVEAMILPLALSFDHRIADGAEAAYFVQCIVKELQKPLALLLEK